VFGSAKALPFDIIACGAALLSQPHCPDLGADALLFPKLHALLAVYQATGGLQGTARYMAVVEVLALHRWGLPQVEVLPARTSYFEPWHHSILLKRPSSASAVFAGCFGRMSRRATYPLAGGCLPACTAVRLPIARAIYCHECSKNLELI
jgi:hypothetical protein